MSKHTFAAYAEAMTIFAKYSDKGWALHPAHDELHAAVDYDEVSDEDKARLDELGWFESSEDAGFMTFT